MYINWQKAGEMVGQGIHMSEFAWSRWWKR